MKYKMWLYLLISFGIFKEAVCIDDMCRKRASLVCPLQDADLLTFPETEEELYNVCEYYRAELICVSTYIYNCGSKNVDIFGMDNQKIPRLMNATAKICDPDSRLYFSLVQILPCLKEIVENDEVFCRDQVREDLLFLEMYMKKSHYSLDRLYDISNCLFSVLENNCFVIQTAKKCGSSAKDVVLEIINQVGVLEFECPKSSEKDVKEMLEAIEVMRREEIHVKNLLK